MKNARVSQILTTGERIQPTLPGVEEQVTKTVQGSDIPPHRPKARSCCPTQSRGRRSARRTFLYDLWHSDATRRRLLRMRRLRHDQRL